MSYYAPDYVPLWVAVGVFVWVVLAWGLVILL